ncbi:MAG: PilN domain-containing protein [Patescibacteria group bacterium]|jgi:Tfp pilus assembly protein PilN
MPDSVQHDAPSEEPFLEMDTEKGGNLSTTILVLLIVLVALVVGFFVFYKYSLVSKAEDKQNTLNSLIDEIQSSSKQEVRDKAAGIESAISILKTASKTKYSFKGFTDELTKKITNDVQIINLSIDEQGNVSLDGVSSSYRAVADLAVALESSDKIENVDIGGLSKGSDGGNEKVSFSMTAKISDWSTGSKTAVQETTADATTSTDSEGVINE